MYTDFEVSVRFSNLDKLNLNKMFFWSTNVLALWTWSKHLKIYLIRLGLF